MKSKFSVMMIITTLFLLPAIASANEYSDTIALFKNAGESAGFFDNSYAYLVLPNVGKGGLGVGAAHGSGRAYKLGKYVGDVKMNQLSIGLQAGGQAYSQIIFFQDKRAFDEFTSGKFELGAQASGVAVTAAASAQATTGGAGVGASGTRQHATTASHYRDGFAVYTIVKGGLMAEASLGGQKFSYRAAN